MKKKDVVIKKIDTKKLKIGIAIAVATVICIILTFTPLMKIYWLKFILELVVRNKWNIWIISAILIALFFVEKKMFLEQNEELKNKGDEEHEIQNR